MIDLEALKNEVIQGKQIIKEEALTLYEAPLIPLCESANEIRRRFCGNLFYICTIIYI